MSRNGEQTPQTSPASATLQAKFQQGLALHQQGRFAEAERACNEILRQEPRHFGALHLLGMVALQTHRTQRSVELIVKAIEIDPNIAAAHGNLGSALSALKHPQKALASYDKAIALKPDYAEAHNNRGNALNELKRFEEAIASYDAAIALKPAFVEAHNNRGAALNALKRFEEAIASYDKAITLKPDYANAYNNRGNALNALKRHDEAIASFDRAIALKPEFAEAHNNRGNALYEITRCEEAIANYDKAITLRSNYAEAHNNRGAALNELRRFEEAIASYDAAIALKPDYAEAHNNRGAALNALNRCEEAIASFDKAIALKPDSEFVLGSLIHAKMKICDWSNLGTQIAQFAPKIDRAEKVSEPFRLLAVTDSAALQRSAAEIFAFVRYPPNISIPNIAKRQRRNKIRIGYFSADFRIHAMGFLLAELFEQHNRSQFEVIAFSFGIDTRDYMRRRLVAAFDRFLDIRNWLDRDVALLSRNLEIDIAVDLAGFTKDCRPGVFSMRAAPLQVNYLGYPGTMGAEYIDYLIADPTLIPTSNQKYFSEKIVYLPNSYQANDRKRRIADKMFTRTGAGLPEDAFVFCCFNNNYKITPEVFDCWMKILKQVAGSVLWLFADNAKAASNLRKEAEIRGVHPERLVFAKRTSLPDHLARHRLADLFLDTLPYNAHTTASDALWAGLPVLTRIGETFAGRVAASLLNAIGLTELITSTPQAYEALAIELAANPEKLAAIKRKLATNRLTTPLFDTQLFTRHIEAAYTAMYERYQADLPPDHIYVPQ